MCWHAAQPKNGALGSCLRRVLNQRIGLHKKFRVTQELVGYTKSIGLHKKYWVTQKVRCCAKISYLIARIRWGYSVVQWYSDSAQRYSIRPAILTSRSTSLLAECA